MSIGTRRRIGYVLSAAAMVTTSLDEWCTLIANGAAIPDPRKTADHHFEVELVMPIGKAGAEMGKEPSLGLVFGYPLGST